MQALRSPTPWHVLLLVALGLAFHASYTQTGLNLMDEGWTLYAGRALHLGWTMYDQLFWVFPPGHALAAWIGWAIDPPGFMVARWIYAGFDIGLAVGLYFLARKLMPAHFALLAGLLLVVAAPDSHRAQGLFAYRYLIWTTLALLCFWYRLESGRRVWLLWAGILVGVAVCFRTTPAFAAGCAIGFGVIFATRDWRVWLRDWAWFGGGILIVLVPVLAYFAAGVGLEAVWENVFVRAVVMTAKQAKPIPDLVTPDSLALRLPVKLWFIAFQFRLHPLVYGAYTLVLGVLYVRALSRRQPFEHALLFAIVVWGGLFFVRSLGRSDWAHLESAIPPMCLLLAHTLAHAVGTGLGGLPLRGRWARRSVEVALAAVLFLTWGYAQGADLVLRRIPIGIPQRAVRSMQPHTWVHSARTAARMDSRMRDIQKWALPGQTILDLTASPGFYALADRSGPGYLDLVLPGTFLDLEDELEFIRVLERDRPAVVIWPSRPFDRSRERGLLATSPRLAQWIQTRYQRRGIDDGRWILMVPIGEADRLNRFSRGQR